MTSSSQNTIELTKALLDGSCLISSAKTTASPDLKSVLTIRLSRYYARLGVGDENPNNNWTLEEVQLITAKEALSVLGRVQQLLGGDVNSPVSSVETAGVPLIGTQDLAELRTLLSLAFKWGVNPLLLKVSVAWPSRQKSTGEPRIMELTTNPNDYKLLTTIVSDLMSLLFPSNSQQRLPQTLITATILDRHITDLLRPCITLGWLPRSRASESTPPLDAIRPMTMKLLNILPPSHTIATLGNILSSGTLPSHVSKTCATLLSRQLQRPHGVRGLCVAVFGGGEAASEDAPLQKLEHISRVLISVPANMDPQEYFQIVIPRIVELLSPMEVPAYKRAAGFTISRMLSTDGSFQHRGPTSSIIFSILHQPFWVVTENIQHQNPQILPSRSPSSTLTLLITLIPSIDPSPTLISALLSPIAPVLYSLLHHTDKVKTSNPNLKESVHGLLVTWGKIVATSEGIGVFWSIVEGDEGEWTVDLEGQVSKQKRSEQTHSLSLLTPDDLGRADEIGRISIDTNLLNLYPDPVHFVHFLKTIDRSDISSDIFVKLLEAYREQKNNPGSNPMRTLLHLQLIIQMQSQLSDSKTSSNILCKPIHLLSFIKHVLEPATAPIRGSNKTLSNDDLQVDMLRFLPAEIKDDLSDGGDSDDDTPGADTITADDEMKATSVNLLLSILEANDDLSARTAPMLNDIFSFLEPLAREGSPTVRSLAREARMVMTARLASTSAPRQSTSRVMAEKNTQEIYQKALKLLQDPILPVRAHGLLLLRQLVTSNKLPGEPMLDNHALVPAILSIFLQSVQDDDSYIFLNAVQGLVAMVDTFGKKVLRSLVKEYSEGLERLGSPAFTQRDLDIRIRVGEALGTVVRRCGESLGIYVDILVPVLSSIFRSRHLPTTLRTSSLSLLAECVNTHSLALLPYTTELANSMLDLLQIENVPANQHPRPPNIGTEGIRDEDRPTMDSQPTSTNPKFPPLRRAALHFLSLLIQATTQKIYDSGSVGTSPFSNAFIKKAKITLAYVSSTDEDNLVRVMSREAGEGLDQLQRAVIGI